MKSLTGLQLAKLLEKKFGYVFVRQKGSHAFYEDPSGKRRSTTIPMHNRSLPIGTQRVIMRQVGLTQDDLV